MHLIYVKKIVANLFIIALFILSYYLFFLSLEKCFDGEAICCMKFKWMKKKVIQELFSCFLSIILLELIIIKKISWFHSIHFTFVFIFFYSYSHGIYFDDHGLYNIKYFFVILIFFIISFNTYLENNIKKNECRIRIPKYCFYKIGKYFLDRTPCSKTSHNSRLHIIKNSKSPFINKNTIHFGFPLTNHENKFLYKMNGITFKKLYCNEIIDMNNLTLLNSLNDSKPEVSVDFSKNETGVFNVNINFNRTLSDERKNLENLTNPYSNNILYNSYNYFISRFSFKSKFNASTEKDLKIL